MNKRIWKQTDSRWGRKPYPTRDCTMSGAGCGCVSCTHIAMEQGRYADWTPENLRPWMVEQGFAIRNQGTTYSGMTKTLHHIGHVNVVVVDKNEPMSKAWTELNKGKRIGILLFRGGKAPDGTEWTANGHYVAFTNYKVEDGKHWFYCKDSGGRKHDGWYSYESSMRGRVYMVWIVERVQIKASAYKPKTAYKGSLPNTVIKNGSKGNDVKLLQMFLNWCINAKLTVDGDAGAKTDTAIMTFQKTYRLVVDGVFGSVSKQKAQSVINAYKPKSTDPLQKWYDALRTQFEWSKNQRYEFNENPTVENSKTEGTCITFPAVSLQRLGLLPKGGYFYLNPNSMQISGNCASYVKEHTELFVLGYPRKTVYELWKSGYLKKGDICGFGNPNYHTMVYMGMHKDGYPLWDTMGHFKGLNVRYRAYEDHAIDMVVRLRKTGK